MLHKLNIEIALFETVFPNSIRGKVEWTKGALTMQPLILLLLQRPYVCDYPSCTKRYTDPRSLRKHKNNSHLKKARKDQREHERESRDDGSSGMAHGAEGDMQKVKDPAFHSALKPEAMYYTDSSELPFMKAHTDPSPSVLQRVHNNTGLYFPPFCADVRDYNAYYHEADQGYYDALPSFSDVQVHPAAPWMPTEYSIIDMAHHTHPPECLACQQPPDAPLKLPTRQCALNRVASLNMALADSSTHLMSLPRVSTQQA